MMRPFRTTRRKVAVTLAVRDGNHQDPVATAGGFLRTGSEISTSEGAGEVPGPEVVKVTTVRILERSKKLVNRLVRQRLKVEIVPHGVDESLQFPLVLLGSFPGVLVVKVDQTETLTEDIGEAKSMLEELPRIQEFKAMQSGVQFLSERLAGR